jgi:DNA-binding transcriptional MerR regulator
MTTYKLAIYSQCHEVLYNLDSASQMARVSIDFLRDCEQEGLIQSKIMVHGEPGYTLAEIRRLARIRRLCDNLALDLAAVEVVLHLRQQVSDLMAHLNQLEQHMNNREADLINEIQALRRQLAEAVEWSPNTE